MKNMSVFLLLLLLHIAQPACRNPEITSNPPGYNLSKPDVYALPAELEEISGIAFNHGNADTIYGEQDEAGKLFYFHWGDKEVKHIKFAKKGDFEDVAVCNGQAIMLRSDGVFFTFALNGPEEVAVQEQEGLLPAGEYESLFADQGNGNLYLLCKNSSEDKAAKAVTGYVLNLGANGALSKKSQFSIDEKALAAAGSAKFKLKASALARHPLTHQWYIVSSVNKLLVITDEQWKPLGTYSLNSQLFTQPEGIAFDQAGNLYISNEKGSATNGSILKFLYHQPK